MDNYYNSPYLALLLRSNGVNVAGTLRLSRKNVPVTISKAKLKKGECVAEECDKIIVLKWKDKRDVAMICTFHSNELVAKRARGVEILKPKCVSDYNQAMGGVDLKDQKLQPYLLERKRGMKWYLKLTYFPA